MPEDDFGPLLPGPAFGGIVQVTRVMFHLGCFTDTRICSRCKKICKFEVSMKTRRLKDGTEKEYVDITLRCTVRTCRRYIPIVTNTIWTKIKDRVLFVFVVDAFLNRSTTVSVVNHTGCKSKTVEKYLKIIKNALFLQNEEEKDDMKLGGEGQTVQGDETHVFTRKYNVGRLLQTPIHGWVFGFVEDKPNGRLFMVMVKHRTRAVLQPIIRAHVHAGTTIFTDCWSAYNGLDVLEGFNHYRVNHSEHFVQRQPVQLTPAQQRRAIQVAVDEFEAAGDDAFEDEGDFEEEMIDVHTQKIERAWREVKRGLGIQHLNVLRRNLGVEMFRYNHLNNSVPFNEMRKIVIHLVAKHKTNVDALLRKRTLCTTTRKRRKK